MLHRLRQRCCFSVLSKTQIASRCAPTTVTRPYTASSLHPSQLIEAQSGSGSIEETIQQLLRASPPPLDNDNRTSSYEEYRSNAGKVLDLVLPYEAYPSNDRRAGSRTDEVVLVLHVAEVEDATSNHVLSSGFIVDANRPDGIGKERLVVSCAHTLEQLEHRYPDTPKRSFVVHLGATGLYELLEIHQIISASPRTDLIVGRLPPTTITDSLRALPVSPYPIYRGQEVLVHLFDESDHSLNTTDGKQSGSSKWGSWVAGQVLGYRGHGWEEVEPGTSSALPYILISTLPTSGSSGGPIVDAASGAVVGMISGRRMDNRVEKERGWGSSAESIFELFSIPGFVPASKRKRN